MGQSLARYVPASPLGGLATKLLTDGDGLTSWSGNHVFATYWSLYSALRAEDLELHGRSCSDYWPWFRIHRAILVSRHYWNSRLASLRLGDPILSCSRSHGSHQGRDGQTLSLRHQERRLRLFNKLVDEREVVSVGRRKSGCWRVGQGYCFLSKSEWPWGSAIEDELVLQRLLTLTFNGFTLVCCDNVQHRIVSNLILKFFPPLPALQIK